MSIAKRFSTAALAAMVAAILALSGLSLAATPVAAFADGDATTPAATPAKTYTIKYKGVSGAKNTNPTSVEKGKLKLKKPTKTGYTFQGWYQGSKKVTTINVKANTTVTAKWKAKTYKITYKNVKGTNKNPAKFTYGKTVKLKKLSKSGYTFMGWYSDKYLVKKVTKAGGKTAKNVTLYAKWVKKPTTAEQKYALKDAKAAIKKANAEGAEVFSQVILQNTGAWIDPEGKRFGCSKKMLVQAMQQQTYYSAKTITFVASNTGTNWYQQALMTANYCKNVSPEDLKPGVTVKDFAELVLQLSGFTNAEIKYALTNAKL